jgi:hypothetical protein
VHPAVLAMDELSHDKAPARMHEPRGVTPTPAMAALRSSPLTLGDSQELTAINDKPPKPALSIDSALPPGVLRGPAKPDLAIESTKGRPGDDDPTKLMVRDDAPVAVAPAARSGGRPAPAVDSVADTKLDVGKTNAPVGGARTDRKIIVGAIVLFVVAAAAIAVYLSGVVH